MATDFRVLFNRLSDDSLINITEFGELIKATAASIYTRRHRGELPSASPLSKARTLLWRVGDVRAWMRGDSPPTSQADSAQCPQHSAAESSSPDHLVRSRVGRPRKSNAAAKLKSHESTPESAQR